MDSFDRSKYVNNFTSIGKTYRITGSTIMKETEEYIFPENNWYIEITDENRKIVNDWKIKQEYSDDLFENLNYKYVYYDGGGERREREAGMVGVGLITTDQFRRYVLNQPIETSEIDDNKHLIRLLKEISLI